jgi:hypothetical protein
MVGDRAVTASHVALVVVALAGGAAAEPKRELPDYDGRGNTDAKNLDVLWLPRVLLSPLYFVHEYFVRRPIGTAFTAAERVHLNKGIERVLYLDANRDVMWFPTFFYDFGMLPSAGLSLHANHAFARDNTIHVHAATWGAHWIAAHVDDRTTWGGGAFEQLAHVELWRRTDLLFYGVGPDVTEATKARYGLLHLDANETVTRRFASESAFALTAGVRGNALRGGTAFDDPSLSDLIASGATMAPPGYDQSHFTVYGRAALRIDSRAARPRSGTGVYLELHGEQHLDVESADAWLRYGGETGVAFDLAGRQRNLKLLVATEFVDPIGRMSDVPFYELAQLGGDDSMAGFLLGWMNGRSVATAGIAYTWPVWTLLDAQLRVAVGNAFDAHLTGLAPKKLRLSADLGVTTIFARETGLQLLVGVGTETFEQGGNITSVRVAIGSRKGF